MRKILSQFIFLPGFAHGFCGLDKENYVIYSCTKYRNSRTEVGIKFDDPFLKIKWPVKKPIISKKIKKIFPLLNMKRKINKQKYLLLVEMVDLLKY